MSQAPDLSFIQGLADWTPYLTRPFTLLGASLWQKWYVSKPLARLGITPCTKALFLDLRNGQVKCYRSQSEVDAFAASLEAFVRQKPDDALKLLERGKKFNGETELILERVRKAKGSHIFDAVLRDIFPTPADIAAYYEELALYATMLPYFWYKKSEGFVSAEQSAALDRACEELRTVSLYPTFYVEVIEPYFAERFKTDAKTVAMRRIDELLSATEIMPHDEGDREHEKPFVYVVNEGTDTVFRVDSVEPIVAMLENAEAHTGEGGELILRGTPVYKGYAKGIARVVTDLNIKDVEFNEGDILVTVNSSPAYMPLILKAGALISEEGGVACHTAVVAIKGKSFKIPTVMGIKNATRKIFNGQKLKIIDGAVHVT